MMQPNVLKLFHDIKCNKNPNCLKKLSINNSSKRLIARLRPITQDILKNAKEIDLIARWRKENSFAFPTQFKVTITGTKIWLENQLINNPTRLLFFVESAEIKPRPIGHMGLYSFDFDKETCEIDNVVRGEKNYLKGVMTSALKTLIRWTNDELIPKNIFLRVFNDNFPAIRFYKNCGFESLHLIPLKKITKPNMIVWEEDATQKNASKLFLKMIFKS